MIVNLSYGKTGLLLEIPETWNVQVIKPDYPPPLLNPRRQLSAALEQPIGSRPLRDLVKPTDIVGIIVNDMTRATPNTILLDTILEQISHVSSENIRFFIALGSHRRMTSNELIDLLGQDNSSKFPIIQNDAFDPGTQEYLGKTSQGTEIWINRELIACDVKILTGFIEPHFFAGFSGAGKAIMPGMAGLETILGNHSAAKVAHPNATWGRTFGNPIWEESREVARKANATFLVNVTLDRQKEITGIFVGDLDAAHAKGVEFVRQSAMIAVDDPFDIVVTTNSGDPLDLNLYQAVKGMSAASQIVRQGGVICIAAACWDGIPEHGNFKRLLAEAGNPETLLQSVMQPGFHKQDQWQAQILAQVLRKARVFLYSDHLTDAEIHSAMLTPTKDILRTISEEIKAIQHPARICVLPEGPQTIPYIA